MKTKSRPKYKFNRVAANLLFVILGTIFALMLIEAGIRILIIVLKCPPIVSSDSQAGWKGRPDLRNITKSYSNGYFNISTDQYGRRISYPVEHIAPDSDPVILLVGDSFVQGVCVQNQETFAWHLAQDLPQYHIINLGVCGYGTDQELLKLEEFFSSNPGVIVSDIVILVFENDFYDIQRSFDPYLGRSKPLFQVQGGVLSRCNYKPYLWDRLMDVSRLVWLINSKLAWFFRSTIIPVEPGIGLVVACLDAMRTYEDRGIRLYVLAHRRLQGSSTIDNFHWKKFLDRSGAVDITKTILAGFGNPVSFDGGHWSSEGHRRVAALVRELMADRKNEHAIFHGSGSN